MPGRPDHGIPRPPGPGPPGRPDHGVPGRAATMTPAIPLDRRRRWGLYLGVRILLQ